MQPARLTPDNFTPPSRTPWGGRRIARIYKTGVAQPEQVIGESWEVSVEPSFPSALEDGALLAATIAADPVAWLGAEVSRRYDGQLPILVKLLDAADDLSVQVHPAPDDPTLTASQSGKPESWIILDAAEGAGLYLGFRDGVQKAQVQACLTSGGRLDALMNFVPVIAGDAFVIDAGTAHAIGAGITLVEPQLVTPGRRGLTYRFWDWNRRYTAGVLDANGTPRPLHVERSLAVTDWSATGEAFVERCRSPRTPLAAGEPTRDRIVDWPYFEVEDWSGTGALTIEAPGTLSALTCVRGAATIEWDAGATRIELGRSIVLPARLGAHRVSLDAAQVIVTRPR